MLKEVINYPEIEVIGSRHRPSIGFDVEALKLADSSLDKRWQGALAAHSCRCTSSGQRRQLDAYLLDSSVSIPEVIMSAELSPIVSEFDTEEQAASYDRWLRAKVQASLDDPSPNVPHDQVMADMRALIESKRNKHDAG